VDLSAKQQKPLWQWPGISPNLNPIEDLGTIDFSYISSIKTVGASSIKTVGGPILGGLWALEIASKL